jgi:hypothetical protein
MREGLIVRCIDLDRECSSRAILPREVVAIATSGRRRNRRRKTSSPIAARMTVDVLTRSDVPGELGYVEADFSPQYLAREKSIVTVGLLRGRLSGVVTLTNLVASTPKHPGYRPPECLRLVQLCGCWRSGRLSFAVPESDDGGRDEFDESPPPALRAPRSCPTTPQRPVRIQRSGQLRARFLLPPQRFAQRLRRVLRLQKHQPIH